MLTVIVPTKNEEEFLPGCLESVAFADEILVLDSGSDDQTVSIAKKYGAKVHEYTWQGFRYSHELGAKLAGHDWILYVDADERISPALAKEISTTLKNPTHQAYQLKRKNFILGQPLQHAGWYPDQVARLIHKSSLKGWVGDLHEYPEVEGSVGQLDGELYHLTHRGIDWSLEKTRSYTRKMAEIYLANNHPKVGVRNFVGAMGREFWSRAVRQQGYKDGLIGWIEIFYQTFNAFLIQAQLWELQQSKTMADQYKAIDTKLKRERNT